MIQKFQSVQAKCITLPYLQVCLSKIILVGIYLLKFVFSIDQVENVRLRLLRVRIV